MLSSRPEFVSGGDALVEIRPPAGTTTAALAVSLNGTTVAASLIADASAGTLRGLIGGLKDGANTLTATAGGTVATITLVNHPVSGPILAGPLQTPYLCMTTESGLGAPLDDNCSATQKISYYYVSTAVPPQVAPLTDPTGARPADLAMTKTITGATVPYIVRVDTGTIGRTIYRIAVLDDPSAATVDPAAWKPGAGWNGRLEVNFLGGAGTSYRQAPRNNTPQDIDIVRAGTLALGRGFAFAMSTELVNQARGNAVLQGETLMMIKEYFIKHYGVPKWTVGVGGSGGAIQQLTITQMYPGLLDGLQPSLSFPDGSLNVPDCGLLVHYDDLADNKTTWTVDKQTAVDGFTRGTCRQWVATFVSIIQAGNAANCDLPQALVWSPSNVTGARCTPQDTRVNIYGRDPATGYARVSLDNVGVQYGLAAVRAGAISLDEFLDLNEKIGGYDVNGAAQPARSVADSLALQAGYESGLLNGGGGGLATVPILQSRNYLDGAGNIHSHERDFAIRARLIKATGDADNQAIWVGPPTGFPLDSLSLDTMTQWLDNLAADPAPLSHAKVVAAKPAEAVDACFDAAGAKTRELASATDPTTACNTMYPVHSEPRLVAGAPIANDVAKCALKPIDFTDYGAAVTFDDARKTRLLAIFPDGVCDFSRPGLKQVPLRDIYQVYPRP